MIIFVKVHSIGVKSSKKGNSQKYQKIEKFLGIFFNLT